MAKVVLVQAWPRNAATGSEVAVRLAGGGSVAYQQLGFFDWRAGVTNVPRFTAGLGFEQVGPTGGAIPTTGAIRFFSSDKSLTSTLAGYVWKDARISVTVGDDETGVYGPATVGKVAGASVEAGVMSITFADLSRDLAKIVIPDTFAGTGGIEGPDEAIGRPKRRSWGAVYNIEGRLLNVANNIYEFGDPSKPLQSFVAVKDKGRDGPLTVIAWAGSIVATYNALVAATPPAGGAAVAPSIACVKWWTQPAGPLTADIQGEIGSGYVSTAPNIAARLVSTYAPTMTITNLATAVGWQAGTAGIHAGDDNETVGSLLDRLLAPLSISWIVTPAGAFEFRRWTFSSPVETIAIEEVVRETVFDPLKKRIVGYRRNYRLHTDGEISAAVLAGDVVFDDGSTLDTTMSDLSALVGVISADLDTKRTVFIQPTAPTAAESEGGDWWMQTDANGRTIATYERMDGTGRITIGNNLIVLGGSYVLFPWKPVEDLRITNALAAATAASDLADRKAVVFTMLAQSDPVPVGTDFGDVLVRAYLNPVQMDYWNGSAWIPAATYGATPAQLTDLANALTSAANAQATADGKVDSFYQPNPPAGTVGDFWIDTDDANKLYRHDGSGWVLSRDTGIASAISAAAGAQATADGKVTTYSSETAPGSANLGDLWVKPSTKAISRWNGSSWGAATASGVADGATVGAPAGTNVGGTAATTVEAGANAANNGLNSDGTVKTDKVSTASIVAGSVVATTISSNSGSGTGGPGISELTYVTVGTLPAGVSGIGISAYGQMKYTGGATPGYPVLRLYRVPAASAAAYLASGSGTGRNPSAYGAQVGKNSTFANWANVDMGASLRHSTISPAQGDLYVLAIDSATYAPGAGSWSMNWSADVAIDILKR